MRKTSILFSLILVLALCFVCSVKGEELPFAVSVKGSPAQLKLTVGKSITLTTDQPIKRASLANPEVVDIRIISPTQIYLQGKKPGSTNLTFWWKEEDRVVIYDLEVFPDVSLLKVKLYESLPGERNIRVTASYDTIILAGEVSSVAVLSQVLALAEVYAPGKVLNLLQVSGVHQVMLEVQIAEMSRSAMEKLGFDFSCKWGGGAPRASGDIFDISISPALIADLLFAHGSTTWTEVISALKENGLAKILAEPTLIALSGQEASFLVGGEIPIPVQSDTGISVEYKKYGIGVTFTPTVLNSKKINMRVAPEVSELDYENAINIAGAMVPGLTTRQASTVVELGDGQSFAIAGLLKDTNREKISKLPILGDVPILGALFRSTEFQRNETELVIIVTLHLVKPLNLAEQNLPTDNHVEPRDVKSLHIIPMIEEDTKD